jgi:UDP-N-acetylglucosamine enolpyruvyl transferase
LTPPVLAEVVLQPLSGTSVVDAEEAITAADVGEHLPGRKELADTARRLAEMGFDIESAGPVTITISGDRELFDRTFGDGEPKVPEGLGDVVAAVTYPQKPELF